MYQRHLLASLFLLLLIMTGTKSVLGQTIALTVTSLNPHIGQQFEARIIDKSTMKEVDRASLEMLVDADFVMNLEGVIGNSYFVDFYADLNKNGVYDAPPMDHAWRIEIDNVVAGVNTVDFAHNTDFVDILWKQLLTLQFTGMNPHVGQQLEIRVRDVNQTGREVGRFTIPSITLPDFSIELPYLEIGRTYILDFYADLNKNGIYDAPPMDHAWRELIKEIEGDTTVTFGHNTNFTDIGESNMLIVDFTGLNPHLGQQLELRVVESATGKEVERIKQMISMANFSIEIPGIKSGTEYNVDFYADLNKNGMYDAPPVDHAWRETFTAGDSNQVISFSHNTNFEDIDWVYQMTLAAVNMDPHLGQLFELKVINTSSSDEVGSFSMPSVMVPFFFVRVPGLRIAENYNVDFYADFNQNGSYDAPPLDHAWRVNFEDDDGDEIVDFSHNTDFTDIMFPTSVRDIQTLKGMNAFPNPFSESISFNIDLNSSTELSFSLYSSSGILIRVLWEGNLPQGENTLTIGDLADIASGIYFVEIRSADGGISHMTLMK